MSLGVTISVGNGGGNSLNSPSPSFKGVGLIKPTPPIAIPKPVISPAEKQARLNTIIQANNAAIQKYNKQAQGYANTANLTNKAAILATPAEIVKGMVTDPVGTVKNIGIGAAKSAVAAADIAWRLSPPGSLWKGTISPAINEVTGKGNLPNLNAEQNFQYQQEKSAGSKTLYEHIFNKDLSKPADQREFIASAAEAPAYFYSGGAIGDSANAEGEGILSKIVHGAAKTAPSGIPFGVGQTIQETDPNQIVKNPVGVAKNLGKNVAENVGAMATLGGVTSGASAVLNKLRTSIAATTNPAIKTAMLRDFISKAKEAKGMTEAPSGNASAIKGLENLPTNAEGGKLVTLNTKDIVRPTNGTDIYGQPIQTSKVSDIVNNFKPNDVNVKVFKNADGKYELLDGSHTLAALDQLGKTKVNATEITNPAAIEAYRTPTLGGNNDFNTKSNEQIITENEGWKNPDIKAQFDAALLHKDASTVEKLLPEVPGAYKATFAKNIEDLGIKLPKTKESSFANTTIQKSTQISESLKASIKDKKIQYTPETEKEGLVNAEQYINSKDLPTATTEALNTVAQKPGTISRQDALNAREVALKLQDKVGNIDVNKATPDQIKDLDSASNIITGLSEHYTSAGQLIQSASLFNKQTPQGMFYQAIKTLGSIKDNSGKSLLDKQPELKEKVSGLVDDIKNTKPGTSERYMATQYLIKAVNDNIPRTLGEKAFGLWRSGLISGLETVGKVINSYAVNTPGDLATRPLASIVDRITSLVTGKRSVTFSPKDLEVGAKGFVRGVKAIPLKLKTGIDAENTGGFTGLDNAKNVMGRSTKQTWFEKAVTRTHAAIPKPESAMTYDMSIAEQARTSAINQGLKGAEKTSFIKDAIDNPTKSMQDIANTEAQKVTNVNSSKVAQAAQKIQSLPYVGKILAPIITVPSNIGVKGLYDISPLGYTNSILDVVRGIRTGVFDQRDFSTATAKASVGTGIAVVGGALMSAGRMSLATPADTKAAKINETGSTPKNSIYIGGKVTKDSGGAFHYAGGRWITLNAMGAAGITAAIGGAFESAKQQGIGDISAAENALFAGGKVLSEQPYLQGISGFSEALNNPSQYANTFMDKTVGSVIPGIVSQTAAGSDTRVRAYPANISDTLKSKIPGLRETLPAEHNAFGQEEAGANPKGTIAGAVVGSVNPLYPTKATNQNDKAFTEIQRLYKVNKANGATLPDISNPASMGGQTVKNYTPQQFQQFLADSGPKIQARLNNLVTTTAYKKLSDDQKATVMNDAITAIRKATPVTASTAKYLPSGKSPDGILKAVGSYASAFMISPSQALNDILNGQTIVKTAGGGIIVERATLKSTQSLIKSRGGSTQKGEKLQLDHVVPLEIGGTNAVSNLSLITKKQDDANNAAEDFLGKQLGHGIDMKTAQKLIVQYKQGKITGQQLYEQAGGKGKSTVPNPTKQTAIVSNPKTKKISALVESASKHPSTFGKIKITKAGKVSLSTK